MPHHRHATHRDLESFANRLKGRELQCGEYSLRLTDILGKGAFGVIFRADEFLGQTKTEHQYAVKCIQGQHVDRFVHRECRLHERCATYSSSIVQLKAVIEGEYLDGEGVVYLVMDWFPDGDLFHAIITREYFVGQDELIKDAFLQIARAVKACHDHGVFHRDIKPENVLCRLPLIPGTGSMHLALADFGLAATDERSVEFGVGSSFYTSLECGTKHDVFGVMCQDYSARSNDVWGLGVLLLNLACGRNPWTRASPEDQCFHAYCHDPDHLMKILPITRALSDALVPVFLPTEGERCTLDDLIQRVSKIDRFTLNWEELMVAPSTVQKAAGPLLPIRQAQWQLAYSPTVSISGTTDPSPIAYCGPSFPAAAAATGGAPVVPAPGQQHPSPPSPFNQLEACLSGSTAFSPDRSPLLPTPTSPRDTPSTVSISTRALFPPANTARVSGRVPRSPFRTLNSSTVTSSPSPCTSKVRNYYRTIPALRYSAGDRLMVR